MSLELFVLLVVTGFAIGINLVITIARSLNRPFFPVPPDYPAGSQDRSSLGGWITVLAIISFGYFLFQSKCASNIADNVMSNMKRPSKNPPPIIDTPVVPYIPLINSLEKSTPKKNPGSDIWAPPPAGSQDRNTEKFERTPTEADWTETPPNSLQAEELSSNKYYIQTGSFGMFENAQKEQQRWIKKLNRNVVLGIVKEGIPGEFKVLIGPFNSLEQLETYRDKKRINGYYPPDTEFIILQY